MEYCISQNLVNKYINLRQKDSKIVWTNSKNFILRILERKEAYQKLINEDIKFAIDAKNIIQNYIIDNNLDIDDLNQITLSLKLHISKNEERVKFLIAFPFIFTLLLIFEKLELLEKVLPNPFNIAAIAFYSFIMLFAFVERTKLIEYKCSLEELILLIEYQINTMEDNKI